MYPYQYLIVVALCGLYFNKQTSKAAEALLLGWAFYIAVTLHLPTEYYYAITALVELIIAYKLNLKYRLVSYMNYSLILVNLYGILLFKHGIQPESYDEIYEIVSIAQLLLLVLRLSHGRIRLPLQCVMDYLVNFDSRKAHGTMQKH